MSGALGPPWLFLTLVASPLARAVNPPVTVNYAAMPTNNNIASPYDTGGVTATTAASGGFAIVNNFGLGIGGAGACTIGGFPAFCGSSSAKFTFDAGLATSVSFIYAIVEGVPPNLAISIQGFGAGGVSLATQSVNLQSFTNPFNVSALFGNVPLPASAFRVVAH